MDSIAQRKRTTDRRCKLLQRPPFISISSLTPMRGPLVTAAISGRPAPLLETLSTAAGGGVITLCFPHGHHHTARWTPRQDSVKPLGPLTLSAASRCLCSALEPSRFLTVAMLEGLCEWMHCFISSCVNRNGPLPFLHFTPFLQRWCISQLHEHPTASEKQLCSLDSGGCSPQTTRDPQGRIGLQWRQTLKTKIRAAHLNTGF